MNQLTAIKSRGGGGLAILLRVFFILGFEVAGNALGQPVATLHSFGDGRVFPDGAGPTGGLVQGMDGNFYGMTPGGGSSTNGVIYQVTPAGAVTILHNFGDGTVTHDGSDPVGSLVVGTDHNFYGATRNGGSASNGIFFKITSAGVMTVLHNFGDGTVANDANNPLSGVVLGPGGNFYGTSESGGSAGNGTAYKITSAGAVTILHNFGDGSVTHDGAIPFGGLVVGTDNNLYGTTLVGGTANDGIFFKVTPTGVFNVLHNFGDGSVPNDGTNPAAALVLGSNGNFYGMTSDGGTANAGTVFTITAAGSETILHHFGDGTVTNDGMGPLGGLVVGTDNNFYGTTDDGGASGNGTVFKITPTGTVTIFHSFGPNGGATAADGIGPEASLVLGSDGNFYGTTGNGGAIGDGTIFELVVQAPNASLSGYVGGTFNYAVQASPSAASYSASYLPSWLSLDPNSGLLFGFPTVSGTFIAKLTTTTAAGASSNFNAVITIGPVSTGPPVITSDLYMFGSDFNYQITATNNPTSYSISPSTPLPAGMTLDNGGFIDGKPTVSGTFTVSLTVSNSAGSDTETLTIFITTNLQTPPVFSVVHDFGNNSVPSDGTTPTSLFQNPDGSIFGTTSAGGNDGLGAIFNQRGIKPRVYASMDGFNGSNPVGVTQGTDGNIYGVAASGGSHNQGTIFKLSPAGIFTILHNFGDGTVANDGAAPAAAMVQGFDGNFYGTTSAGGSFNRGIIFSVTPAGVVTIIHSFGDGSTANDGSDPVAALIFIQDAPPNTGFCLSSNGGYYPNGTFFGTTRTGGSHGSGTVFSMTTAGVVTTLHSFGDPTVTNDGANPMASVTMNSDGNLYGTTYSGGLAGQGTIFSVMPDGTSYAIFHVFGDGSVAHDGANPQGGLTFIGSGTMAGTTKYGGSAGDGTIFNFSPSTSPQPVILYDFASNAAQGINPTSSISYDNQGDIYGTAQGGGTNSAGIIYVVQVYQFNRNNLGKSPGITYSLTAGALPSPMTISSATGAPLGTPSPGDALGIYSFTVTGVVTTSGAVKSVTQETMVLGSYSFITTTSLPAAALQASYSAQLQATNPSDDMLAYAATGLPPGITCSSSGLIAGTPTSGGTYSVSVSAANRLGPGPATVFMMTVSSMTQGPLQNFTQWERNYAIDADSDPADIPKNDGVPNLLKYLFDIDPTIAMNAADVAALPVIGVDTTTHPGTNYLTLTYREYAEATGVTINVQTSTDLKNWTTVTPDIVQQIGTDAGDLDAGDPVMEVEVNINGATHEFIRLNVTSP